MEKESKKEKKIKKVKGYKGIGAWEGGKVDSVTFPVHI
jgi:hypothetical protein